MLKLCAAGDIILMDSLPEDYSVVCKTLLEYMMEADMRIANMETTISEHDVYASTYCGGTWLTAPPAILDALDRFGFLYYSFANNHSMDYSYGGLESTLEALRYHKVQYGGAGADLAQASRHSLLHCSNGDAAVISVCATCNDAARAGTPHGSIPGRPGLNMLRHRETYAINADHMASLKEIAGAVNINGRINNSKKGGYTPDEPGIFNLGTLNFIQSENEGKRSVPDPNDCIRIEASIRKAKADTANVIVYLHTHEIKGSTDDEPDFFVEDFCRRCTEAGASAVICSGSHQIKGIEMHNGAPIFYSIANFIFHSDRVAELPNDFYEKYSIDPSWSAGQALAVRSANGTRGLQCDISNYQALVPTLYLESGKVTRIEIAPIELCFSASYGMKGLPRLATGDAFNSIYEKLSALCMPYGTAPSAQNGRIVLGTDPPANNKG